MRAVIWEGDCRDALRAMPDESVHCVVTSPPYFSLRDYSVEGQIGLERSADCLGWATRVRCDECYVCVMREVFAEVRRVLRSDGTCFLNLGDSYANDGKWGGSTSGKHAAGLHGSGSVGRMRRETGLKSKDLILMPHRVALALQADGWYVRMDNVWAKGSVMPESVEDRPTRNHEYVFLLSKSPTYFYDQFAVREPAEDWGFHDRTNWKAKNVPGQPPQTACSDANFAARGKNRRSVWRINSRPFPEAHFAVMAPGLAELCIRAGSSERGCCPLCLAPYRRVTERCESEPDPSQRGTAHYNTAERYGARNGGNAGLDVLASRMREGGNGVRTTGWAAGCSCDAGEPQPCTVLDPFSGAATTGVVAGKLGRDYVGCELNPEYNDMAERRIIREVGPLLVTVERRSLDATDRAAARREGER